MKTPPYNEEAEQAVLASLMIEENAFGKVEGVLSADDFYNRHNKVIFSHIEKLYYSGNVYDVSVLVSSLRASNDLERVGGVEYLSDLTYIIPNASNIERYANIVKGKAKLRRLKSTAGDIDKLADNYNTDITLDPAEAVNEAGQLIFELAKDASNKDPKHVNQLLTPVFNNIEEQCKSGTNTTGMPSGFIDLDRIINGLQRGSLIIIAGRPGMGKTAFAVNMAQSISKDKKTVAIFSLEMVNTQIVQRIISAEAEVSQNGIQNGTLSQGDWEKLADAANTISKMSLFIDDTSNISVMEIRTKCRRMKAGKDGLDLVIIDYLQLVENKRIENREQQIADISRNLKALAKELDVSVIALSQLNRSVEARANKTPLLSDLRESGAIEQDADQILFVYRDKDAANKGIAEIFISKNRNGKTGEVRLGFIDHLTKFRNLDRE